MAKNHSRQPTNRTQMQKQNIRTFNLFTFTFFEAGFIRWHTTYLSSSHSHTHTQRDHADEMHIRSAHRCSPLRTYQKLNSCGYLLLLICAVRICAQTYYAVEAVRCWRSQYDVRGAITARAWAQRRCLCPLFVQFIARKLTKPKDHIKQWLDVGLCNSSRLNGLLTALADLQIEMPPCEARQ